MDPGLIDALDLLCRLRWDSLHRVYFLDTEMKADDSCLLLDVMGLNAVVGSAYIGAAVGSIDSHTDTEDQSLSLMRSIFSVLAKVLTVIVGVKTLL